ncbi:MAG: MarR family transcriptional regulator [Acidimicrobiia bacterium]|nr:MarR family transcriptional regulator [Acidimicrobiia bacterium]
MDVKRMKVSDALISESELASSLRLSVTRLARRLRQHSSAEAEVSPSQLATLSSVERLGPVTLGDLAAVERVQPPTMTRIVSGLEEAGLVSRHVDERDRRIARVQTTVAGRKFLDRTRSRKDLYLSGRIRTLDADDRAVLARAAVILEKMLEGEGP